MAENDNDQERTERPTARRLEKAREEAHVPRSPELNAAAVLLVTGASLRFLGGSIAATLFDIMQSALRLSPAQALDPGLALSTAAAELLRALIVCAPLFGLTMVAAMVAPLTTKNWMSRKNERHGIFHAGSAGQMRSSNTSRRISKALRPPEIAT